MTKTAVSFILDRVHHVENEFLLLGVLFFILAAAIVVFPEIIQILFVIGFFMASFSLLFVSIKLGHIRHSLGEALGVTKRSKRS